MSVSFQRIHDFKWPKYQAPLWRYMSLDKFESLLSSGLYFCDLPTLLKGDPHEGALTLPNIRHREWLSVDDINVTEDDRRMAGITSEDSSAVRADKFDLHRRRLEQRCRMRILTIPFVSVSCWHANKDESAAMWSAYGNEGLAIVSSFEKLEDSIVRHNEIFCGKVRYINFKTQEIRLEDEWLPFTKRKSFKHEKEVRLMIREPILESVLRQYHRACESLTRDTHEGILRDRRYEEVYEMPTNSYLSHPLAARGGPIKTDCSILIQRIVVSPTATDAFRNSIQDKCDRFGLKVVIERSEITSPAII